jgi:hypothetical protein
MQEIQFVPHTMTGETEEDLLANAKKHGMEVHGYSEEQWNEDIQKTTTTLAVL